MGIDVVDIRTFQSMNSSREYFLDTNVLYWYCYPRITGTQMPVNAKPYYSFVDSLVSSGNPILTSVYNISELLNIVEKNEFSIFKDSHPEADYSIKDFRKDSGERSRMQQNLRTTLSNVTNTCTVLSFNFDEPCMEAFVDSFATHRCDVFDYVILRNCIANNKLNIVTDDNDFSTISGIKLYTANEITINAAK